MWFSACYYWWYNTTSFIIYEWSWHNKEKWSNIWAVYFNECKTVNVDFNKKNVNFPAIQFVYNGEMINNKTRHVHLQSDGGWYNNISGIYENGI